MNYGIWANLQAGDYPSGTLDSHINKLNLSFLAELESNRQKQQAYAHDIKKYIWS